MKIIKLIPQAIKRDPSYLIIAIITMCLVFMMLSEHKWNKEAEHKWNKEGSVTPSLLINELPDFSSFNSVKEKKRAFFNYLRPLVRQENNRISYDRALLKHLSDDFSQSPHHNSVTLGKLTRLAKRYHLEVKDIQHSINELKLRVDFIPESLVLVQAANESAWGTSRFARQANNYFGQWCYSKGCGLVPKGRIEDAIHEVKRFDDVKSSVVSYMKNLNSHQAYQQLREIRSQLRATGQKVTGIRLAQGLVNYSERGDIYIEELTTMIRQNRLE